MPKVAKRNSLYICNISIKVRDLIDFLPADKRKSFLQVKGIILGVHSQACPKYSISSKTSISSKM